MYLYDVKPNSKIRLLSEKPQTPPAGDIGITGEEYIFLHLDGMYSYCKDMKGNPTHLVAWSQVEVVDE